MLNDRESLVEEIERLEKELQSQHFRALFDHKSEHQKQKRLKKLRHKLAELEGTLVVSQPVRRAEPKPLPKPKAPRPAVVPAFAPTQVIAPKSPAKTATPAKPATKKAATKKPALQPKPAIKKASGARKNAVKSPVRKTTKPAARKKSK